LGQFFSPDPVQSTMNVLSDFYTSHKTMKLFGAQLRDWGCHVQHMLIDIPYILGPQVETTPDHTSRPNTTPASSLHSQLVNKLCRYISMTPETMDRPDSRAQAACCRGESDVIHVERHVQRWIQFERFSPFNFSERHGGILV